ncbi:hypothetical protein JKP88DRAFT_282521 [Tribonema minus]|uniref:Uncharacterized protein n=1 Tax=Tribonema minus TaxID=303371 RepID=A0A835YNF5_9STRA|nr:hypothetical protein JKP88DRAFT_282521 [Tribonema minus]
MTVVELAAMLQSAFNIGELERAVGLLAPNGAVIPLAAICRAPALLPKVRAFALLVKTADQDDEGVYPISALTPVSDELRGGRFALDNGLWEAHIMEVIRQLTARGRLSAQEGLALARRLKRTPDYSPPSSEVIQQLTARGRLSAQEGLALARCAAAGDAVVLACCRIADAVGGGGAAYLADALKLAAAALVAVGGGGRGGEGGGGGGGEGLVHAAQRNLAGFAEVLLATGHCDLAGLTTRHVTADEYISLLHQTLNLGHDIMSAYADFAGGDGLKALLLRLVELGQINSDDGADQGGEDEADDDSGGGGAEELDEASGSGGTRRSSVAVTDADRRLRRSVLLSALALADVARVSAQQRRAAAALIDAEHSAALRAFEATSAALVYRNNGEVALLIDTLVGLPAATKLQGVSAAALSTRRVSQATSRGFDDIETVDGATTVNENGEDDYDGGYGAYSGGGGGDEAALWQDSDVKDFTTGYGAEQYEQYDNDADADADAASDKDDDDDRKAEAMWSRTARTAAGRDDNHGDDDQQEDGSGDDEQGGDGDAQQDGDGGDDQQDGDGGPEEEGGSAAAMLWVRVARLVDSCAQLLRLLRVRGLLTGDGEAALRAMAQRKSAALFAADIEDLMETLVQAARIELELSAATDESRNDDAQARGPPLRDEMAAWDGRYEPVTGKASAGSTMSILRLPGGPADPGNGDSASGDSDDDEHAAAEDEQEDAYPQHDEGADNRRVATSGARADALLAQRFAAMKARAEAAAEEESEPAERVTTLSGVEESEPADGGTTLSGLNDGGGAADRASGGGGAAADRAGDRDLCMEVGALVASLTKRGLLSRKQRVLLLSQLNRGLLSRKQRVLLLSQLNRGVGDEARAAYRAYLRTKDPRELFAALMAMTGQQQQQQPLRRAASIAAAHAPRIKGRNSMSPVPEDPAADGFDETDETDDDDGGRSADGSDGGGEDHGDGVDDDGGGSSEGQREEGDEDASASAALEEPSGHFVRLVRGMHADATAAVDELSGHFVRVVGGMQLEAAQVTALRIGLRKQDPDVPSALMEYSETGNRQELEAALMRVMRRHEGCQPQARAVPLAA